jgi:hypothetical protein
VTISKPTDSASQPPLKLKDPIFAAVLAWLLPGVGHLYQGRTAKGLLFMVCILGTYFFGLSLGDGHVVYASWRTNDVRLPYLCQVGVGLPALPALVQAQRVSAGKAPLFDGRMAPPHLPDSRNNFDELAQWHKEYNRDFELGTVYTMIAGLLNILAIYDALDGPAFGEDEEKKKSDDDPDDKVEAKPPT